MKISSLQKGLVGHWTMSQDSLKGSLLADKTPYENDGTIYGATFTTDRKGQANKAMSFDGVNDYVEKVNFNLNKGLNTLSLWIKVLSLPSTSSIIFIHQPSKTGLGFYQGNSFILTSGASVDKQRRCDLSNFIVGQWNHVLISYNESNIPSVYINGREPNYLSSNYWTQTSTTLFLGKRDTGNFFNGQIDDVRIYNYALTDTQIKTLYNQNSTVRFGE